MSSNFRSVANTGGFIAPGAIFKFIQTNGLVNFNGEFRTVALIGTATVNLPKIGEQIIRGASVNTADTLSESTANSIDLVGNFGSLRNYLEHRPGARLLPDDVATSLADKIEIEFLQKSAVTEDYIITVERIGGNGDITDPDTGAYSITTVSTGEVSIWYAVNDQYANQAAIPGVNLKVSTTIGEQLGNTATLRVLVDPTEGDYLFTAGSGQIDWSPNVNSTPFGQRIGIPVQTSPTDAFSIIDLKPYDTATYGNLATVADTLVQPGFVTDGLDNATYKFYAVSTNQYSVDKVKSGVSFTAISGFELVGNSSAPITLFNANEPYIIDGMVVNLNVISPANSMQVNTYGSPARILTQKKAGMKSIEDVITVFPIPGNQPLTDTFTLRVNKSDNASTGVSSGTYTLTSGTSEITSAPILCKLAQNLAVMNGCSLTVSSTRIKDQDLTGWNLILNGSLEGGSLTSPTNWVLGTMATVVELPTISQIHGTRVLKVPANTAVGAGPTVTTFKYTNSNTVRASKISWYARSADGTSSTVASGLKARINWIGAAGVVLSTTDVAETHQFNGTVTRFISGSYDIPVGSIQAQVILYNNSSVDAYMDAVQLEQTDGSGNILDFHESDVAVVRTTEHRIPKEPLPAISAHMVLPEDKQSMLNLIQLDAIRGTNRVTSDWVVKKLDSSSYQVTRTTTGETFGPLLVDIRYTNVIPGTGVMVKSITDDSTVSWNDFASNTIAIVSTASGINATSSIPARAYFVNYQYRRPENEFYTTKAFLQIPDLLADLGDSTPANSLSLGGVIAFENGATIVQTIQLDEDVDLDAALNDLSKVYTNIVVPMLTVDLVEGGDGTGRPTDAQYDRVTQINSQLLDHAVLMSQPLERRERIVVSSQLPGRDLILFGAEAQAMNNERLVLVGPTSVIKDVKNAQTGFSDATVLEGCYLAAAVAGLACRYDVAEPWLRKSLLGFRGLGETLTDSDANFLGGSGITVVGTRRTANPLDGRVAASNVAGQNGALMISIASTTCTTGTVDQVEPSVVQSKDYIGRTVRNLLDEIYIGQKNIPAVRSNIEGTTKNILTNMVQSQIINDFQGLTVTTDPVEPRAVNVAFEIAPVFPINYILITFSLIPTASPNSNLIR